MKFEKGDFSFEVTSGKELIAIVAVVGIGGVVVNQTIKSAEKLALRDDLPVVLGKGANLILSMRKKRNELPFFDEKNDNLL